MGLFVIRIGYVDTGHWQYPKKWLVANAHFAGEGHMHHDHPVLVGIARVDKYRHGQAIHVG